MLKRKNKGEPAPEEGQRKARTSNPQGITASGNALRRIVVIATLVALLPLGLGFAYLLAIWLPAMQDRQIEAVAQSFASQQATGVHRYISDLERRIRSAAKSPLALSAIASQSEQDLDLVEKALLDHFPEVISLRLVPVGEMGTARFEGGSEGLRNHIEVDLVRRAADADTPQPESYQFEGQWLTSMAALVEHPRITQRKAVILATIDNRNLSELIASLDSTAGKFNLEQHFQTNAGIERKDVVATSGSGDGTRYTREAEIPGSKWRVSFTPSRALQQKVAFDPVQPGAVLALCALGILAAAIVVLRSFSRTLESEVNRVISAADRKTPLELAVPQLVSLAKQLRRATLRALRQGGSGYPSEIPKAEVETLPARGSDFIDPLFQSTSILDDEEDLDLTLGAGDDGALQGPGKDGLPNHIFRAYDIRGNAKTELTDELVGRIGRAIGTLAGEMDEQTLIVGSDGRLSSPRIKSTLIRALMETGRDVIDIGLVPTPLLYFATRHLNCRSGIMVTGSHNPAGDNGFKIVLNQKTIAAGGIQQIRELVVRNEFSKGAGRMIREDVSPDYLEEVLSDIAISVPLKVVIDAGNGATSKLAPQLFEELGCEVVTLFCEVDGNFPNHSPDTSDERNLAALAKTVVAQQADFGVAFDGDGDRLAIVSASGSIIRPDTLLMIFAQDVVSRNPGADVVFDVKCSRHLTQLITRYGGRPVLWKTGHAFMKEKMLETGALLGGEFSGHIFFGERWYGFDDGMYAAARLAEILSTHGESLDGLLAALPQGVSTPEILIPVPESRKFQLVQRLVENAAFTNGKVNTLDGIRVDFADGWGLVRASNTNPVLTARFEADSASALEAIKSEFRAQLALTDPDLELNF